MSLSNVPSSIRTTRQVIEPVDSSSRSVLTLLGPDTEKKVKLKWTLQLEKVTGLLGAYWPSEGTELVVGWRPSTSSKAKKQLGPKGKSKKVPIESNGELLFRRSPFASSLSSLGQGGSRSLEREDSSSFSSEPPTALPYFDLDAEGPKKQREKDRGSNDFCVSMTAHRETTVASNVNSLASHWKPLFLMWSLQNPNSGKIKRSKTLARGLFPLIDHAFCEPICRRVELIPTGSGVSAATLPVFLWLSIQCEIAEGRSRLGVSPSSSSVPMLISQTAHLALKPPPSLSLSPSLSPFPASPSPDLTMTGPSSERSNEELQAGNVKLEALKNERAQLQKELDALRSSYSELKASKTSSEAEMASMRETFEETRQSRKAEILELYQTLSDGLCALVEREREVYCASQRLKQTVRATRDHIAAHRIDQQSSQPGLASSPSSSSGSVIIQFVLFIATLVVGILFNLFIATDRKIQW